MQTLSVVGAEPDLAAVAERLDGRTATVVAGEVPAPETGAVTVTLSPDGDRQTRATDDSFSAVLDRLAPEYDHALVAGFSRLRLPTVVVGDREVPGRVVRRVEAAGELSAAELAETVRSVEPYVTLASLVARAKDAEGTDRSGALATFTGRVRAKDGPDDDRTTHLAFERYDEVAERRLAEIEAELAARDGVFGVWTHHRVGVIPDGEDIVFVVVLAGHREEAFETVSDGIDRLKSEVPIFKKETTVSDEFWTHEHE
ncbi:molybdopterin synthase [Halobaculum sp. MBLA0143]|uniref:molybdopterin synthase n=1 Tax=Halobaculum sp. MBLA0143 TaxID=3079933 RepID=UPI0035238536